MDTFVVNVSEVEYWSCQEIWLFADYINAFFKEKIEASGWPSCTVDDKESYTEKTLEKEGIRLGSNRIEKNPGRKAVSS
jgi:hypothetical protein